MTDRNVWVVETQDGTMFSHTVTGFFQCSDYEADKLISFDNGKCSLRYFKFYSYDEAVAFRDSFETGV